MLLCLHRDGVPKDVLLATQYYRFRSTPKDITGESHEAASLPGRGAARTGERKRGSRLADLDPSDAQCGHQRLALATKDSSPNLDAPIVCDAAPRPCAQRNSIRTVKGHIRIQNSGSAPGPPTPPRQPGESKP